MEVYFKFTSAKNYESIPIDWHYTTVSDLKYSIYKKKFSVRDRRNDCDLIVTNAQTNEEYLDGEALIPKNTSVIIRRVPKLRCRPIIIPPATDQNKPLAEDKLDDVQATKKSFSGEDSFVSVYPEESEWDDFWNNSSAPKVVPVQDARPSKADEDSKIRALIDTPAPDWQCPNPHSFGSGRGFGRGMGGRSEGRGFGRGLLERKTPPPGYICHRCNMPGHFIQHCSTNGDPNYDIKRTKPPTGIPKSMLMATPDGSYALPSGAVAILKPNEAAFEKEIEGMPSNRSVADLPPELYCPLCRAVMKDAVLASKCCFKSFCDKCIRDYIISKSLCICKAKNVLADDLLPNKTLRDTIVRYLKSNNSSGANGGSSFQPQVMESARCPQPEIQCPKVPSPLSAALKGDVLAPTNEGNTKVKDMTEPVKVDNVTETISGKEIVGKGAEVCEAAQECVREPGSQICPPVTDEEMLQKPVSGEVGKKKKKKLADMQSRPRQDFAAENYLMPVELSGYNPYWNGMQPEFDGFGRPYGGQMPFMGYGLGPASIPFGGAFHHDPFGAQVYTMPFPPQSMEVSRDRDFSRDMISHEDVSSAKSKYKSITPPDYHKPLPRSGRPSPDYSSRDPELLRTSSKRKVKYDDDYYTEHPCQLREKERRRHHLSESVSATRLPVLPDTVLPLSSKSSTNKKISDQKHKANVFSRIISPERESAAPKKRKLDSSFPAVNRSSHQSNDRTTSNGNHEDHRKTEVAASKNSYKFAEDHDYESSDDDRHFKRRRRSRYESSPAPAVVKGRHSSRGLGEKGVIAASIGRLSAY